MADASDKKADLSPAQARELLASFGEPETEKDARDKAIVSLMLHTGDNPCSNTANSIPPSATAPFSA